MSPRLPFDRLALLGPDPLKVALDHTGSDRKLKESDREIRRVGIKPRTGINERV